MSSESSAPTHDFTPSPNTRPSTNITTATLASRIRGAFHGLAVCDALGGPVEFRSRGSFSLVTELLPNNNFGLPAGCFTDDTSQALCLAHSLLAHGGEHDTLDQVQAYLRWREEGYMSVTGECFDIGTATNEILSRWQQQLLLTSDNNTASASSRIQSRITNEFAVESKCGNGSLMRVLPVALVAASESSAASLARASSLTTHPHQRCLDACALYARLVYRALQSASKAELERHLASLVNSSSKEQIESVLLAALRPYATTPSLWRDTPASQIRSTGYVLHSLEASLWAFFSTDSFEDGAVRVVNLGDDADTVGAIYGGLAGAFYGFDAIPQRWRQGMAQVGQEMVEKAVQGILELRGLQERQE